MAQHTLFTGQWADLTLDEVAEQVAALRRIIRGD